MKKKLKGKIITFDEDMFIEGTQGSSKRLTGSNLATARELEKAKEYIDIYTEVYKSLPYPMYLLEEPIKYILIAQLMKKKLGKEKKLECNVDNGLKIKLEVDLDLLGAGAGASSGSELGLCLGLGSKENKERVTDNDTYLHFINSTWRIEQGETKVKLKEIEESDELICCNKVKYYKEYKWLYDKLKAGKDISGFYRTHCKEINSVCHNKKELKEVLGSLLEVEEPTVDKIPNTIIYPAKQLEYRVVPYTTDMTLTGKKEYYYNSATKKIEQEDETEMHYAPYIQLRKVDMESNFTGKLVLHSNPQEGLISFFSKYMEIAHEQGNINDIGYWGVVLGATLYFELSTKLGKYVYMTTFNEYTKAKMVSNQGTILGYTDDKVWFIEEDGANMYYTIDRKSKEITFEGVRELCQD
jgi:hypothetical protein